MLGQTVGRAGNPLLQLSHTHVQGRVPMGEAGAWDPEELIRHDFATL